MFCCHIYTRVQTLTRILTTARVAAETASNQTPEGLMGNGSGVTAQRILGSAGVKKENVLSAQHREIFLFFKAVFRQCRQNENGAAQTLHLLVSGLPGGL